MKKTIMLKTMKGNEFSVEIELVRESRKEEVNADGHTVTVDKFVEITNAKATSKGKTTNGNFSTSLPKWAPEGTYAIAGSMADKLILCINKEQYEKYRETLNSMIVEAEKNNAAVDARNKRIKENEEYEKSREMIRKAMNY